MNPAVPPVTAAVASLYADDDETRAALAANLAAPPDPAELSPEDRAELERMTAILDHLKAAIAAAGRGVPFSLVKFARRAGPETALVWMVRAGETKGADGVSRANYVPVAAAIEDPAAFLAEWAPLERAPKK